MGNEFNLLPAHSKHNTPLKSDAPQPKIHRSDVSGASAGMPRFLGRMRVYPKLQHQVQNDPLETQADRAASAVGRHEPAGASRLSEQIGVSRSTVGIPNQPLLQSQHTAGVPLRQDTCREMESHFGADFNEVRIHDDPGAHQLANSMNANALTTGNDIYFNQGQYVPDSTSGQSLLAHELTHVIQQDGQPGTPQFDLMQTLPTAPGALGYFEMEMATRGAPRPGLEGDIRFFPDPNGPYSAQIGLIQVVNVTDITGQTTPASGAPVDWSNVGTGAEAARNTIRTTGADVSPPGWFVDVNSAANAQSSNIGPNYIQHWISPAPRNRFGWLRSPTDWGFTSLYDYPWFSFDVDFEFETVAKATDTQAVYGALEWGFGIRSGVVQDEYARASDTQSAVFEEALEHFRGYYTHEPLVLYFDTDNDFPMAGEENKIQGVLDYLNRYPDVMLQIDGYADERGSAAHNAGLAQRRAETVELLCLAMGISPNRIDWAVGWGETHRSAAGTTAGALRANRRVEIHFQRTASSTIVMP